MIEKQVYAIVSGYVPVEVAAKLNEVSRDKEISLSNLVRRILKEYVKNLEEKEENEAAEEE